MSISNTPSMSRRIFLLIVSLIFSQLILGCAHKAIQQSDSLSIMQGLTTANTSQFSILAPKNTELSYLIQGPEENIDVSFETFTHPESDWAIHKVMAEKLKLNENYTLEVYDKSANRLLDRRHFKTLDTSKKNVRLLVASCLDDGFDEVQQQIWPEALSYKPELIFLIGDNVYADKYGKSKTAAPDQLWRRYTETRNKLSLYRSKNLIPILAARDDHDYGANDGDRTYPYRKESNEIFSQFFAQEPITGVLSAGPGISAHLSAFGQEFLFLDNRSFRSSKGSLPETIWGAEQEKWLLAILNKGSKPAWIINGDQIFGGYQRFESYEGDRKQSFERMMKKLGEAKSPVFFLTGDRHLAESMIIKPPEFPYTTYELTTSAIHAKVYPGAWDEVKNPRQMHGVSGEYNYAIIDTELESPTKAKLNLFVYGLGNKLHFKESLAVTR